jgi:rhodanese-related sulfurtransferase|tara:strand:- start:29 stop:445 length:417 start_codon:yes stop_codon:yes gene_type:complete
MDKFVLFLTDNYLAVLLLFFLLLALMVYESRKGGKKIDASEATRIINKENAFVVDLRTPVEFNSGTIAGAVNLQPDNVDKDNSLFKANERDYVILVCKLGSSSNSVGGRLIKQGFQNVNILSGGIQGWVQSGLPLIKQ